jgi:hypothetical protein
MFMRITLDHTVIASANNETAARRFADIMGLCVGEREGADDKFISVRVNDTLRLFFVSASSVMCRHLAFVVDDGTFDQILDRLRRMQAPFGNSPRDTGNGRTDHPLCATRAVLERS